MINPLLIVVSTCLGFNNVKLWHTMIVNLISNQGKEKSEIFPSFWVFLRIFFLENYDFSLTTKATLTTIVKENNHLCVPKPLKFH